MATQSEKFRKIKEEAKKSGAKPAIKTAAKLASQYNDLSKNAKKAAMAVIDKAYDMATSEKSSPRITTPYKELYAKFLREYRAEGSAKSAWKEGTSSVAGTNRDVVKDAGRPALKKGKRTVKLKGYTTNQYGRFKNKVGSTYYESRSNRMDVNTPVSKKKVKLEYGGMANAGMMTKKKKAFKMPTNEEFNNMTFKQQQAVFLKWAETQGIMDINDPNFMFNNGGSLKKKVVTKKYVNGGEFSEEEYVVFVVPNQEGQNLGLKAQNIVVKADSKKEAERLAKKRFARQNKASESLLAIETTQLKSWVDRFQVKNQYKGHTAKEIWNALEFHQRQHFLKDHRIVAEIKIEDIRDAYWCDWDELNDQFKAAAIAFEEHVKEGQYAKGGMSEHGLKTGDRIVGKSGRYGAKIYNKQSREAGSINLNSGKRNVRKYSRGGLFGENARVQYLSEEFASSDLLEKFRKASKIEGNDVTNKDVLAFAYTDYGGDFMDKVAIAYFLENYPKNIVVENTGWNGKNALIWGKPAKEFIESTQDYPLGFEDLESFYYEMQDKEERDDFEYFLDDLEKYNNYTFDKEEVMDWLMENRSGYYRLTTQGLDFSYDELQDVLEDEGLIKKDDE
jgi:hypothetical protein